MSIRCLPIVPLMCLSIALALPSHAAQIYKWVDENGVTHFTQYAPPNKESKAINSRQNTSTSASSNESTSSPQSSIMQEYEKLEKQLKELEEAQDGSQKEQQIALVKKQNCEKGQKGLEELLRSPRIRLKQKNGEVKLLTEKERQQKIDIARQSIEKNCG